MKSISTIKPAITENTECTIAEAHAPVIDINAVYHYTSFHFSFSNIWLLFQAKNNARSAPACTALTYTVSLTPKPYNMRTAIHHLYAVR